MITAKTITDEQIRDLRKDQKLESVCFCALYLAGAVGAAARAQCAEVLNARKAVVFKCGQNVVLGGEEPS